MSRPPWVIVHSPPSCSATKEAFFNQISEVLLEVIVAQGGSSPPDVGPCLGLRIVVRVLQDLESYLHPTLSCARHPVSTLYPSLHLIP